MQEEAQKILVDLLKGAAKGIDAAVSFSQAQIPDVIQQLLLWNLIYSVILNVVAILLIIGYLWVAWKGVKKGIDCFIPLTPDQLEHNRNETWEHKRFRREEWTEGSGFLRDKNDVIDGGSVVVIMVVGIAVTVVSACMINADWLKIWLAPKLYLLEYAASLMK